MDGIIASLANETTDLRYYEKIKKELNLPGKEDNYEDCSEEKEKAVK